MNTDNLYKLTLIVILVLATIQLVKIFSKQSVIEMKEHMNPSLLTHQVENLAKEPTDKPDINFYYKGDRYTEPNEIPQQVDPLSRNTGIQCAPQFNWDVNLTPGANNVYGDVLWHKVSPKMILEKGCMSCGNKNIVNPPQAIEAYDNILDKTPFFEAYERPFDEKAMDEYDRMINTQRNFGSTNSGLPPLEQDFLNKCNVGKMFDVEGNMTDIRK